MMKRMKAGMAALCSAAMLVLVAPIQAQAGAGAQAVGSHPSRPLCLSLQDRAELGDLMARYAIYADAGAGEAFASTFVPEGELIIRDQVVHGQASLAAMISGKTSRTLHLPSAPVLVKMADGTVHARSQLLFMRESKRGDGEATAALPESGFAVYEDVIVKTASGWKFQRRRAAEVQSLAPEFLSEHPAPVCAERP